MSADVSANLKDWSASEASNAPAGTTSISSNLDDNLRQIQAVVRQDLATKGSDIASAGTTDLGAVAGLFHDITGTTTVTGLGTVSAGVWKVLQFDSTPMLVHSATVLGLPSSANITAAAGDTAIVMSLGSGNWTVPFYQRKSGLPVSGDFPDSFFRVVGSSDATKKLAIEVDGLTTATTRTLTVPDANLTLPPVTAKGDIPAASAAGVLTVVGVGTDAQILAADSTQTTGVVWRDKVSSSATSVGTGTAYTISGIPSYAKIITIPVNGISLNGTSEIVLQLGDSGGLENSGYTGTSARMGSSGGVYTGLSSSFVLTESAAAASVYYGVIRLILIDAATNTWAIDAKLTTTSANNMNITTGIKSLTGTLTQLALMSANGTSVFDSGSIGWLVE